MPRAQEPNKTTTIAGGVSLLVVTGTIWAAQHILDKLEHHAQPYEDSPRWAKWLRG